MHLAQTLYQICSRPGNRQQLQLIDIPFYLCILFENITSRIDSITKDPTSPANQPRDANISESIFSYIFHFGGIYSQTQPSAAAGAAAATGSEGNSNEIMDNDANSLSKWYLLDARVAFVFLCSISEYEQDIRRHALDVFVEERSCPFHARGEQRLLGAVLGECGGAPAASAEHGRWHPPSPARCIRQRATTTAATATSWRRSHRH